MLGAFPARALDMALMQSAAQRLGPAAVQSLAPLQALLGVASQLEVPQRLVAVNRFFNQRIAYATDRAVWGQEDYWASPLESLSRGQGDCEDYAIAKYAVLIAAGTPASHLRLVYVYARRDTPGATPRTQVEAHMVLAYQAGGDDEPMVLDNLRAEVLPAAARPDLTPVYSFGADGLWQGTGPVSVGDPLVRLTRWRELLQKMRAEGW